LIPVVVGTIVVALILSAVVVFLVLRAEPPRRRAALLDHPSRRCSSALPTSTASTAPSGRGAVAGRTWRPWGVEKIHT
jgi:hypothetical protein